MSAPGEQERVLAERIRERDQGIMTVTECKMRRLFCVRDGRLIHAASNIIEEQFEEFLVREERISPSERARSKLESSREEIPALEWLVRQDILADDELDAAAAEHARGLLLEALSSPKAEAEFEKGIPNLEGKALTDRPLTPLLFQLLEVHPKDRDIHSRVGRPDMLPVRVPEFEGAVRDLAAEHSVLLEVWDYAQGALNVSQIVRNVGGGEKAGLRALYGLILIGAVQAITQSDRLSKSLRDVPVSQNELLARLDRAIDADHYGVLDMMRDVKDEQIQSSYYVLARRYHPDRFRTGEFTELLPRIESFFAQVTAAYNTLSDVDAGGVLGANTGIGDRVGHRFRLSGILTPTK